MAIHHQRPTELVQQPGRDPRQAGQAVIGIKQHCKFITRQARNGVGLRQGLGDAFGHFLQHMVRQLMPEIVIEQFETIEIDVQQRQVARALAYTLASLLQAFLEQKAVGQPGQLIKTGQVAHPRFAQTALLDLIGKLGIELLTTDIGLLQIFAQTLMPQAAHHAPLPDPLDLPSQTARQQEKPMPMPKKTPGEFKL